MKDLSITDGFEAAVLTDLQKFPPFSLELFPQSCHMLGADYMLGTLHISYLEHLMILQGS